MSRILLAAPHVGEIGWELMSWQGRVRRMYRRGGYDRVVVLGGPGKAAFYDGMPLDYRAIDLSHLPGEAYEDRRYIGHSKEIVAADELKRLLEPLVQNVVAESRADGDTVDVLWPEYAGKPCSCDPEHQAFIRYERKISELPSEPWVVLVQRTRAHGAERNWPAESWVRLARLLADRGVHTTIYPCEAEAAITMLSGCDLAVGQSTGGLHLAALCGCPTLVWSVQDYLMWQWEITNRQRYETWWNPLGSPVVFHEAASLPTPEAAADQIMGALQAIGRRTGSSVQRALFRGKWTLRSTLRRSIIEPRRYRRWPWPVQKFVRYELA